MTERQEVVLRMIDRSQAVRGYGPSARELCTWMGWSSPNAAQQMIVALRRQGMLHRGSVDTPREARTIRLTPRGERFLDLQDFRMALRTRMFRMIHPEAIDSAALPALEVS